MFLKCLKQTKPMPRAISTVVPNQSSNEESPMVYLPAIELEEKNIRLQVASRKAFSELIKILSEPTKKMEEWKSKWHTFYEKNQEHITEAETIWELFDTAVCSIETLIEGHHQSIETLTTARDLITKPREEESLKFKIEQARSDVNELIEEVDKLQEELQKLGRKLHRHQSNSPSNLTKTIDWKTRHEDLDQRYTQLEASIAKKKKQLEKQKCLFEKKQVKLLVKSKSVEVERWSLLTEQLEVFVASLKIDSEEIMGKFKTYDPKKDFEEWERSTLCRSNKQSAKTQSTENEVCNTKQRSNRKVAKENSDVEE